MLGLSTTTTFDTPTNMRSFSIPIAVLEWPIKAAYLAAFCAFKRVLNYKLNNHFEIAASTLPVDSIQKGISL